MAALRLTKAESCGVDYDDELAPVKPPASFHASLANTNTLGCRAHYSGTAQPHLFFRLHLCLLGIFCMRFLSCVNIWEHPQHCYTREKALLLRPCHCHQCLVCPTTPVSLLTLEPFICRTQKQHAPLEGMRHLASLLCSIRPACIGLPSVLGLPTVITWCLTQKPICRRELPLLNYHSYCISLHPTAPLLETVPAWPSSYRSHSAEDLSYPKLMRPSGNRRASVSAKTTPDHQHCNVKW